MKKKRTNYVGLYLKCIAKWAVDFLRVFIKNAFYWNSAQDRCLFVAQERLRLTYKSTRLEQVYVPDFVCYGTIILEIKAVKELAMEHKAQVFNYLKATGYGLGLLANFGSHPKAQIERIII